MQSPLSLLVFRAGGLSLALDARRVRRVLAAAEITPAPRGPKAMLGVLDVAGTVLPVMDPAVRLGRPPEELHPEQSFIWALSSRRQMLLRVQAVSGLETADAAGFVPQADLAPGLNAVSGALKREDGLVWIQDLDRFLSSEEEEAVDAALKEAERAGSDAR